MLFARLSLLFRLAYRSVFRNLRRTVLTVLAVAVGIAACNALASFMRGMGDAAVQDAIQNLTGHIQLHASGYLEDPVIEHRIDGVSEDLERGLSGEGIEYWSKRIRVPGVVMSERESAAVTLIGVDPAREQNVSVLPQGVRSGRYLEAADDGGIVVGRRLLETLETRIGKRVVLMTQGADGGNADRGFRVVGVFDAELESTEMSYVFVGLETAQNMLGAERQLSEIVVLAKQRSRVDEVRELLSRVAPELDVKTWKELEPLVVSLVEVQGKVMYLWFFIVLLSVAFGLVNTMCMAIFERTRELALYQALGMNQRDVLLQILFESFLVVVFGALLGNILTAVLLLYFSGGIDLSDFARGTDMFGVSSIVIPKFFYQDGIVSNIMIVLLGIAGTFFPAIQASRHRPVVGLSKI